MKTILLPLFLSLSLAAGAFVPVDLKCNDQSGGLVTAADPRLSWRILAEGRGTVQSAWQVLVASDPQLLMKDQGDLWDSGKVEAGRSPIVAYGGKDLVAGQRCYWKVRAWNGEDKPSAWSKIALWEAAPQAPADWAGAKWIEDGKENPEKDEDFYKNDPAPLMRTEFTIEKPVLRARLHVAGLGLSLPSLNGRRIVDHVFDPPWTNFDKRIHFRTHDVTGQLKSGDNCLGVTLGNGWYNPLPLRMWGHRNIRGSILTGRPRAIACLVITHSDGTTTTVTTGPGWKTSEGPTLRNSIYLGEERDARLAKPGWDTAGFDDAGWKPVKVTDHSLGQLEALEMPPIRLQEPLEAAKVTTPKPGVHIVDFGENHTGLPEIDLEVPAGTKITLRFGELLHEDGTLNPMTSVCGQIKGMRKQKDGTMRPVGGPGAPEVAWQQDVYIAAGGRETFRPDFTFHAFRYMEVVGVPEAPAPESCRSHPMYTDLASAGTFESSNELLNEIQKMCRRTFLANVVSVQSDCPHRERFGYGGDIVATSETYLMNFDMTGFYPKTVRDWGDAARPDGRFTDTAPFVGIDYCGVGWAMVHPLLLEQLYQHYGDLSLLQEQVPLAIKWFDGEAGRRKDGLVTKGLGDHEALVGARGPVLSTPMFIDTALRMARLCSIIGRDEDAARMEKLAEESAAAWVTSFLDSASGKVGEGTQTNQAFALGFRAAPEEVKEKVFEVLAADLTAPEDGPRLTTGIYGTWHLLEQLSRHGRHDLAYGLATRRTFPSWGWMLENDATTLWEDWKGTDNVKSHNHPMFGSVSGWFFRWLGGIQADPEAVGFDRIVIRPQVLPGLKWVNTSHRSIRGPITSNWKVEGKARSYEIGIPANTSAVIELPVGEQEALTEGGKALKDAVGIEVLDVVDGIQRLKVGGGSYRFAVEPKE